ncbi:MAG: hypothetical protein ACKON9_01705 [Planctomycetaceae bacterium]
MKALARNAQPKPNGFLSPEKTAPDPVVPAIMFQNTDESRADGFWEDLGRTSVSANPK